MAERYVPMNEFDGKAVAEALDGAAAGIRDVAHGPGELLALQSGRTRLEAFPQAGVARATTDVARIELFRVGRYGTDAGRVVFDTGDGDERTRLTLRSDGQVRLGPFRDAVAARAAGTEASDAHEAVGRPTTTRTDGEKGNPPTPPPQAAPEAPEGSVAGRQMSPEAGEVEVVTLTGRLGRDPWHRPDGDEPIGGFPLAVNSTDGAATTWHKVVVFGETATELAESFRRKQIRKGSPVDVTGQEVLREEPTARGVKKIREFRASEVMRVTYSRSRSAPRT